VNFNCFASIWINQRWYSIWLDHALGRRRPVAGAKLINRIRQ